MIFKSWILGTMFAIFSVFIILLICMGSLYVSAKNLENSINNEQMNTKINGPKDASGQNFDGPIADGPVAIHLTGARDMLSLRKSKGEDGATNPLYRINVWDEEVAQNNAENFKVLDHSQIEVLHNGSYYVYAQLSLRKKGGLINFSIVKSTLDAEDVFLSQFVIDFLKPEYAILKTGFTAMVTELKEGDRISLAIYRDDLSIDFQDGKSFLGIIDLTG